MKKLFYLMCLLPLALTGCKNAPRIFDVMDGPGMVNEQFMSLDKIESEWKGGDIPVQNGSERPSVIDLLTAFNERFPSFGVDSLLRKLNEPGFEGEYYAEDGRAPSSISLRRNMCCCPPKLMPRVWRRVLCAVKTVTVFSCAH